MAVAFGCAHAQSVQTLEPVVVSAARHEQRLSEVIPSVSVIDRDQIERSQARDLASLLLSEPGFEFGRNGNAPKFLGEVNSRFKTPANALIANSLVGIIALLTGKTGQIITIAVFCAITLYIISMISVIQLRRNEPEMPRPFKVPLYPLAPVVALVIASVSLFALTVYNRQLALIYFGILILSFIAYKTIKK
jgi:ethanolamine permease